jgi:hypothetical protein
MLQASIDSFTNAAMNLSIVTVTGPRPTAFKRFCKFLAPSGGFSTRRDGRAEAGGAPRSASDKTPPSHPNVSSCLSGSRGCRRLPRRTGFSAGPASHADYCLADTDTPIIERYKVDPSPDRAIQRAQIAGCVGASSHQPPPKDWAPIHHHPRGGVTQLYQPLHQETEVPGLPLLETAPDPPNQPAGRGPGHSVTLLGLEPTVTTTTIVNATLRASLLAPYPSVPCAPPLAIVVASPPAAQLFKHTPPRRSTPLPCTPGTGHPPPPPGRAPPEGLPHLPSNIYVNAPCPGHRPRGWGPGHESQSP